VSLFGKSSKSNSDNTTISEVKERSLPSATTTVIGNGSRFNGDFVSSDPVTIEGEVKGTIMVKNHVIVGKSGVVEADMKVQSLQVHGTVTGDVVAKDRVSIETSGAIDGNVSAGKLAISEGAIFRGNIDMSDGSNRKIAATKGKQLEEVKEA